jgi:hypothetical protein
MSTTTNSPATTTQYELVTATGNIALLMAMSATLSPAEVAAATTAEQTFTVTGLLVGDIVYVTKPTTNAGLGIVGARVSANNTLAIAFVNATAGALTPTASQSYTLLVARPYAQTITNGLPTSLPTA